MPGPHRWPDRHREPVRQGKLTHRDVLGSRAESQVHAASRQATLPTVPGLRALGLRATQTGGADPPLSPHRSPDAPPPADVSATQPLHLRVPTRRKLATAVGRAANGTSV